MKLFLWSKVKHTNEKGSVHGLKPYGFLWVCIETKKGAWSVFPIWWRKL